MHLLLSPVCFKRLKNNTQFLITAVAGENPNWSTVPGRLKQLDVSPANIVWGVNRHDNIYMLNNRNSWKHIGGLLKHVSVGSSGVWGVNSGDNIYYRKGVTLSNPAGTQWKHIGGKKKNNFVALAKLDVEYW